jgi:hypothetical protein
MARIQPLNPLAKLEEHSLALRSISVLNPTVWNQNGVLAAPNLHAIE